MLWVAFPSRFHGAKWLGFLERIITKRAKADDLNEAYAPVGEEGIKTVIQFKTWPD